MVIICFTICRLISRETIVILDSLNYIKGMPCEYVMHLSMVFEGGGMGSPWKFSSNCSTREGILASITIPCLSPFRKLSVNHWEKLPKGKGISH